MSKEPNYKSYVRQLGERTRVDSGLRVLPDIASCTTYGTKGCVVRIRKRDGKEVWRTKLKGRDLVVVAVEPDGIFAYTRGRLWALEPDKGAVRWTNELPGLGYGPAIIASANQIPVTVAAIQAAAQASAQMSPVAGAAAS